MAKVVKIWKGDLMMRSKRLAKNKDLQKKVLCSLLAVGVMSVCISGGDVWAAGTIKDQDMVITSNMNIVADDGGFEGATNRYAAIGHTQDATMTVTAKPGVIVNSVVTATNGRAMGIVNTGNGVLNVNGNYGFALQADTVRGIRNNGYNDLNLNGDFIIKAVSEGKDSNNDVVVGAEAFNGTNITVNGDKLNIDITTDNARIIGVQNFNNNGKTIVFNSNDISIKAVQTGTGSFCQGVLGYQSTTNFNGDIVIDLKADKVTSQVHGVDIQCDPGNTYETAVNFNNQQTDIKVEGGAGATVAAIRASGVPGTVNLNGKVTNLTAANINGGMAAAIISQYGAHVNSGSETNINAAVNAKDDAVAVYVGEYAGYNGNVELQGNFTADVISENGNAYGILGELSDDAKSEDDGKIYIGKDLELDVTAANGDAVGIGVSGKYNKTIILGNSTINATGKTASYAIIAEDGGQITVGSAGKNVNLTGDVKVDGGSVINHGDVTINGQLLVKAAGASSEYTSIGESLRINAGSDSAVQIENSSQKNVSNVLNFNSKNTELSSSGSSYISAVNILNNNQPDVTASNTVNFRGDTTKITATATDGKAQGVRIGESNFGSGKLTTDINFGATNTSINVKGNVVAGDYYDQVAGIWEGEGSYKGDVATNIAFNGKANIDVYSQGGNAYGIFVEHGSEIGTTIIDFNDNTVINAQNANGSGEAVYISGDGVAVNFNKAQKKGVTVDIIGDITAANNAKITLAGDSNVVKGTVTADAGGIVLAGSDKATYIVNKFVTKDSVSRFTTVTRGTITVSGGTLNIDNLSDINKFDLADNSLIVTGKGVLKAASDKVFEADTSGKKVIAGVDQKVLFNGGKLAISDTSYTLADSKVYSEALGKVDDSGVGANTKTTIVMTGTLQDQPVDNKATVDDLAPTGAVHTNVTGTVSTGTLNVGDGSSSEGATGVNNDLGVKDLDFSSNSGTVDASVTISNDTGLTLVGDGSSELLKGTGSNNTVTVGSTSDSGSAGTLTLGNAAAESSGGTLNANVTLQSDSQMNVEAGSFTVDKITATEGTVAVNAGANLTTTQDFTVGDAINNKTGTIDAAGSITAGKVDLQQGTVAVTGSLTANELSVGTSNKEGTVTAAGTVDVGTLNLNKGNVEVTGSLTAKTLTVGDSDAKIAVGAADRAGTLTAEDVKLGGASLMLDPAWEDGSTIQTASKAGLKFNGSQIDGKLTVGQNSVLSLGTADTAKAEAAFTDTGLTWGQNDITAALYIDYEQTMDSTKGGIKVDGSLTHASDSKDLVAANTATFRSRLAADGRR